MQNREKRLINNTVMLYLLKFSSMIFPIITLPYLTRILGKELYSVHTFVLSFVNYFVLLIDFGFILSATKEIAEYKENKEKIQDILYSVTAAKLFFVLVSGIIILVTFFLITNIRLNWQYVLLSFISIALTALMPDFLFRGLEKMGAITLRYLITKLIFTGSIFIFVKGSADFLLIPIIMIIGELVALIITWFYIKYKLRYKFVVPRFSMIWNQIKASSVYFYSRIASTLYSNTNTFVLGIYYPSSVAVFGISNAIIVSIKGLYSPIADSLYPYMVLNKNFKMIKKILLFFMPLIFLGCIVLFIWAPFFINILSGAEYIEAVPILRYMIPILIVGLPAYILGFPTMSPLGLTKQANRSVVLSSIFHFISMLVLIIFGMITMESVAILTSITETLVLLIRIIYIANNRNIKGFIKMRKFLHWIKSNIIMKGIYFLFSIFPIKKNKIYFVAYYGKKYACSPRAISEYLYNEHHDEFEIIWEINNEKQRELIPQDVKCVRTNTFMQYYHYYTSGIIINNCRSTYHLFKRKNQYYIQTWHGSLPLKKIEKDAMGLSDSYIKMAKIDSEKIDVLLSGSKAYTEIKRKCFWYDGEILLTGLPRCDILFNATSEYKKNVRKVLGISENAKIVLYAPTFRDNTDISTYKLDDSKLLKILEKRYEGDWKLLYKLHPNMLEKSRELCLSENVLDVTSYSDIQDILLIADVLITDFSSSMFEFMLLKKPCFLFFNDVKQYVNQERGLNFELEDLPFPQGDTLEELLVAIEDFDEDKYNNNINSFINEIGSVEKGVSCKNVYNHIKKCNDK